MKKRLVLKPFVVPMLYTVFAIFVLGSLVLSIEVIKDKENITYVNGVILDEYIPVVNTEEKINRPYTSDKVTKSNSYYNYKGTDEEQTKSIIVHDNTYIQNTGITYTAPEQFEVVSILDGEVVEVDTKEMLGKTITIKHDKDIISTYQSLGEVSVKKGDKVTANQVIGKSGKSDLINTTDNNMHFEMYINGSIVNPEEYFDKELGEI